MKRWFALSTLSLACAQAWATPVWHPSGPNLTYGAVSNNQTIISNVTNPAAGAMVFSKGENQYRFGILSSVGFGYEFGDVENLYDEIDSAQTTLENTQPVDYATVCASAGSDVNLCADLVAAYLNTTALAPVNAVLNTMQSDGYATGFFSGHVPVMPLVVSHQGLGGSFVLDANFSTVARMTFLSDPVALTGSDVLTQVQAYSGSGPLDITVPENSTDSAMLVRAGAVAEIGFGYSRPVINAETGDLIVGMRAKYYMVGLTRVATRLMDSSGAEDTFDASEDYKESSGIGLDVGALWVSRHYRLGAWVDNINKPSFDYPEVELTGYTDAATIAALQKSQKYEMNSQLHLEGAVHSESQNWVVNIGLDANEAEDPTGNAYKWATLSAGYATDSWWIPGVRVGYRTNMAGSELSYLTGGLTLFKTANLDIAYALDSVEVDGEKAPRSMMVNLGFELTF